MAQRQDWIGAAVAALRHGGVDAVRVEPLARGLGVTKGSFYWHFADRAELLEAVLALWEQETVALVAEASRGETPAERLQQFFRLAAANESYPPDAAIFAWAASDALVARRAEATEARRIEFLRRQLRASGLDEDEAARRADAAYLASLGWIERAGRVTGMEQDLDALMEFLLGLLVGQVAAR